MRLLKSGQHFGENKRSIRLLGTILTEAGYTPDIHVPWHYHENAYFFYHLRGRLDEHNKKKTVVCKPGTLLFHHWQDPHYDRNFSVDARFFHVEIGNEWFLRHQLKPAMLEGSMQLDNPLLQPVFQKIHKEIRLNDNITQISVDGMLLEAIAEIVRHGRQKDPKTPAWVKKVKEILHDNLATRLTLEMLSLETGVHPVHLSKEFPRHFQVGFGQYLRSLRVQKAITLLPDKNLTLSDIAFACGFSDQSHFTRCFKESMGTVPSEFRKFAVEG